MGQIGHPVIRHTAHGVFAGFLRRLHRIAAHHPVEPAAELAHFRHAVLPEVQRQAVIIIIICQHHHAAHGAGSRCKWTAPSGAAGMAWLHPPDPDECRGSARSACACGSSRSIIKRISRRRARMAIRFLSILHGFVIQLDDAFRAFFREFSEFFAAKRHCRACSAFRVL